MRASLEGVRAKIDRSKYHLEQFGAAFSSATPSCRVALRSKERDSEGNHVVIGDITCMDPPPHVGVHLGDAVHNLRSALDHLVCQLAFAAGNAHKWNVTQFPIFCEDTSDNRSVMRRRTKWVAPAAQAEIEALQPFRRCPHDPSTDLLWLLSELDNIDKHRLLIVANPKFAQLRVDLTIDGTARSYTVSNNPAWDPLRLDAVPFRFVIPNDPTKPQTQVQVDAHPLTGVVFAQTRLKCDGREAAPLVRDMIADVNDIVATFERKGLI